MKRWYEEIKKSETHITSDEINEGAPIISSDPTPSEEETNYSTSQTSDTRTDQRPISLDAAEWWVKDLNLNQNDRHNLLSGEWLTDKLIDSVNRLISLHMGDATGRQTTLLSQVPSGFRSITGNGIQILHDRDHWVATACLANEVLYADSLNRGISDYVKMSDASAVCLTYHSLWKSQSHSLLSPANVNQICLTVVFLQLHLLFSGLLAQRHCLPLTIRTQCEDIWYEVLKIKQLWSSQFYQLESEGAPRKIS